MPKSRSSRRNRKGRKTAPKPAAAPTTRVVAQPVAVAAPGEAPTVAAPRKERAGPSRATRHDYSYVRRDLQRIAVLTAAVLVTIVVVSFFLP